MAMHYLPALLLFPLAGVAADGAPRELVMAGACGVGAVAAASLALIRSASALPALFGLLLLQFGAQQFYEPTRRAITPSLVPPDGLPLATTLDTICWSAMTGVGAAAGGAALSRLGPAACFLIDGATYAVAAASALSLRNLPRWAPAGGSGAAAAVAARLKARSSELGEIESVGCGGAGLQTADSAGGDGEWAGDGLEQRHRPAAVAPAAGGSGGSPSLSTPRTPASPPSPPRPLQPAPTLTLASAVARGVADVREGFNYVTHPARRHVLALATVKACGASVWGAADILNVRLSEEPAVRGTRDAASTLGLIFACVGVGSLVGPIAANLIVPPTPRALLRAVAASFAALASGYVVMVGAGGLGGVALGTATRAAGSSVLWVRGNG